MNTDTIDALLKKFYTGTSTVEEERTIAEYFRSNTDVPQRYATDRDIILGLSDDITTDSKIAVPQNLGSKLNYMIDNFAENEDEGTTSSTSESAKIKINWKLTASIAACVALLFGIYMSLYNNDSDSAPSQSDLTAQNSSIISIDTIKHRVCTQPGVSASAKTDAENTKVADEDVNIAELKTLFRHRKKLRHTSKAEIEAAEQQIESIGEPASPELSVLIAEIAFQKLAQRLDRSMTSLDITESKIELIPESIEITN